MNSTLREDADAIIRASLNAVLPDEAVRRALEAFRPSKGRVLLVAAGKAAWQMAHTAVEVLGRVDGGVVVTKYHHGKGEIPGVACYEAGHPVPDENGFAATVKRKSGSFLADPAPQAGREGKKPPGNAHQYLRECCLSI